MDKIRHAKGAIPTADLRRELQAKGARRGANPEKGGSSGGKEHLVGGG